MNDRDKSRSSRRRRHVRFGTVLVAVLAMLFGTALSVLSTVPANAQAGTPPYWADSPFNVPSGTGASVPFTQYSAGNAFTNRAAVGPALLPGPPASQAG